MKRRLFYLRTEASNPLGEVWCRNNHNLLSPNALTALILNHSPPQKLINGHVQQSSLISFLKTTRNYKANILISLKELSKLALNGEVKNINYGKRSQ